MRATLYLIYAVLLGPVTLSLRGDPSDWTWHNPLPNGNFMNDIRAIDGNTAIAVGDVDTIMKTTDGGQNWYLVDTGALSSLETIYFIDENRGWIGGFRGILLRTTDGGETWLPAVSFINSTIQAFYFSDPLNGWAVGGGGVSNSMARTTDGGETWTPVSTGSNKQLNSIHFADTSTAWAAGVGGTLVHSTDGGATWAPRSSGFNSTIIAIHFADADNGWIFGSRYLRTTDGGETWTQWSPTGSGTKAHFSDDRNGWAVLTTGVISRTTDGGSSWDVVLGGIRNVLNDVWFSDRQRGWAVGASRMILRTDDGGRTWNPISVSSAASQYNAMSFVSDDRGWIVGNHRSILHTADGGRTWVPQEHGTTWTFSDVFFIDTMTGWAVSITGILHTADGGATWTQQAGVFGGLSSIIGAQSVWFTDAQHGRIIGTVGLMAETSDGGETWTALEFGNGIHSVVTSNPLHAIHLLDFNTGWAVGGTGTLLRLGDLPDTIDLQEPALRAESIFLDGIGGVRLTWTPGEAEWSLESTRDLAGQDWGDVESAKAYGEDWGLTSRLDHSHALAKPCLL